MIELLNESNNTIVCRVNDMFYTIHCGESIHVNEMDMFEISHETENYYSKVADSSKALKFLSFLGDPFKLVMDYHIVIDSVYQLNENYENQQIIIKHKTKWIDVDTYTYYDYFVLHFQNQALVPQNSYTRNADIFYNIYKMNNKKLARWNAVWNIVIEPIVLESIGYFLIYQLFHMWFDKTAVYIVMMLITFNILLDIFLFLLISNRSKHIRRFQEYLKSDSINQFMNKIN